jgi:hypothetical protein
VFTIFYVLLFGSFFLSLKIHTFVSYMNGSMAFELDRVGKVEGVYHVYHERSFRIYHEVGGSEDKTLGFGMPAQMMRE